MGHQHDFILRFKVQFKVKSGPCKSYGLKSSTHRTGSPHHQISSRILGSKSSPIHSQEFNYDMELNKLWN